MNRNEFLIATGLAGLVAVLLILQIVFVRMANYDQARVYQAQQLIQQGQICLKSLQQVALRTAQLSQQTGDQALKDLMARQQIAIGAPPSQGSTDNSQSMPASTPVPPVAH